MDEEIAPVMTITFSNEADTDILLYKTKLCEFIQTFPELNLKTVDNVMNVFKNSSISTEKEDLDEVDSAPSKLASKKSRKKKKRQKDPVFFLDTKPSFDDGNCIPISTGEVRKLGIDEDEPVKITFGPTCFNCEGNHSIRDCPLPKDMAKINSNKQNHQKNRNVRYHLEDDLKFGHIQAGKISDNLRNALGLKKFEIPPYIYKMRLIGYPPGWFEAAKLTSSELLMYDGKGNTIKNQNAKKATGLDEEKIIRFPGFNAPLGSGFKDEYRHYGVPKYSDTQFPKQVEEYIKFAQSQIDDLETENMDIDATSDAGSEDVAILNLQEAKEIEAISLQELENQKNSILEEIKKSQETVPWTPPCETNENIVVEENALKTPNDNEQKTEIEKEKSEELHSKIETENSDGNTPADTNDKEISEIVDLSATPTETQDELTLNNSVPEISVGTPKATIMGTPIFKKTLSPYVQVPPLEHFREGVSQVINYENLPNTEGKYEAMRGVLQKIRLLKP